MITVFKALDLKNELEKFKYNLLKENKGSIYTIVLHNTTVDIDNYCEGFKYTIYFSDYIDKFKLEVYVLGLGNYEIEEKGNKKYFENVINDYLDFIDLLFTYDYRKSYE